MESQLIFCLPKVSIFLISYSKFDKIVFTKESIKRARMLRQEALLYNMF